MNRFLLSALFSALVSTAVAQQEPQAPAAFRPFSHLDLSLTAGTTGLGFDLAAPVSKMVQVRAGFSFMPRADVDMHFGVQVGQKAEGESWEEFNQRSNSNFGKLAELLTGFTGYEVDNTVVMQGQPTYYQGKLLVDVMPFKDKRWHFTAGFYYGNEDAGRAVNRGEDMATLMAVGIYNNLYERIAYKTPRELSEIEILPGFGLDLDNLLPLQEKFESYGRMGIHIGDYKHDIKDSEGKVIHKAGDPYIMEPDKNSMVKAWAKVNRFKPYLGFGYGGRLIKGNDRWGVSFDAGVMWWGGAPELITHDGTDLAHDLINVRGKVGDYTDVIKKFTVFPVIDLRITRRLF